MYIERGIKVLDYPRPQFVRETWQSLNGLWAYAFDETEQPGGVTWQGDICVPYPPESSLSRVDDQDFHEVAWYRRSFSVPDAWQGKRVRLHFGAVDYRAKVWVNGQRVVEHEGGHTPFFADITNVLRENEQEVVVRAEDDPFDMSQPRGKQDWQREPHAIWYPRTTGIWQPVWLEPLSQSHIADLRLTPHLNDFAVHTAVEVAGDTEGLRLELSFTHGETVLAADGWQLTGAKMQRRVHLSVNGFDDLRRYIWSPEQPNLIDISLKLLRGETVLDEVTSYTGSALGRSQKRQGLFERSPLFSAARPGPGLLGRWPVGRARR